MVQINNLQAHPGTLERATHIANFSIFKPEKMKYIQQIDTAHIRHCWTKTMTMPYIRLIVYSETLGQTSASKPIDSPTLQNPGNPSNHTPIQKRILTELYTLEELERLDPQANQKSRDHFLLNFNWTCSTLD